MVSSPDHTPTSPRIHVSRDRILVFRMESVTESVTSTQAEQRAPLGYLTCETLFQGVWIARHAKTGLEKLLTRAHGAVPQTGNTLVGVYTYTIINVIVTSQNL